MIHYLWSNRELPNFNEIWCLIIFQTASYFTAFYQCLSSRAQGLIHLVLLKEQGRHIEYFHFCNCSLNQCQYLTSFVDFISLCRCYYYVKHYAAAKVRYLYQTQMPFRSDFHWHFCLRLTLIFGVMTLNQAMKLIDVEIIDGFATSGYKEFMGF